MLKSKLKVCHRHFPINRRYSEHVAHFESVCRRITMHVTVNDEIYLPVFPKDIADRKNKFFPRSEGVKFSNFRKVVFALSDE